MKSKFYLFLLLAFISTGLKAATNTAIVNGGNWSSAGTWSLARIPANGDNIVISAGYTVIFDNSSSLNGVTINISGTLNFSQNNTLALDAASTVIIGSGGSITATHATPNELLTIAGKTKYDGKNDGTITGPAEATAATGSSPTGFTNIVLPVTFVSFSANRSNDAVQLIWNTTNEINNSHFEVERSADGTNWETIGEVAAGTSSLADSYTYTDESAPSAQTQYRICQIDVNGNFIYSTIVLVSGTQTTTAQPTIIASGKTISIFPANASGNRLFVRVITISGQVLQQQSFETASARIDLTVSTSTVGVYVVQVTDGSQWSVAKKVML
ncbi:MAG TPA: G8 domain-containing protein [Puia sp.]|nr:G8 domain-containing protein [Puia sp.]